MNNAKERLIGTGMGRFTALCPAMGARQRLLIVGIIKRVRTFVEDHRNIGAKRLVVGAHYGFRDWLAQRITAIVMGIYTVILLLSFLTGNDFSYVGWAGMFAQQWFKIATFVTFVATLMDSLPFGALAGLEGPADFNPLATLGTAGAR